MTPTPHHWAFLSPFRIYHCCTNRSTFQTISIKNITHSSEFPLLTFVESGDLSTWITYNMSSQDRVRRYTRGGRRRKPMLDVDLNVVPQMPCDQEGTSNYASSQDRQEGTTPLTAAIDLDAYDDDVIISSPRAFAEAKNNSRRNHGRIVVVDLESEERPPHNKRARFPTSQTICDFYINLEGSSNSNSMRNRGQRATLTLPPPKEPTFSCPVCMGTLVEETSTKCGHIFCKACIKAAIAAQGKCPTCRRKITMKDMIRIYLPATNST